MMLVDDAFAPTSDGIDIGRLPANALRVSSPMALFRTSMTRTLIDGYQIAHDIDMVKNKSISFPTLCFVG